MLALAVITSGGLYLFRATEELRVAQANFGTNLGTTQANLKITQTNLEAELNEARQNFSDFVAEKDKRIAQLDQQDKSLLEETRKAKEEIAQLGKALLDLRAEAFDPGQIYKEAEKSVVSIKVGDGEKTGTGFLFKTSAGRIVIITVFHVVKGTPLESLKVEILPNDGVYPSIWGRVIWIDPETDLAVIAIFPLVEGKPLLPGTATLAIGEPVAVIGDPVFNSLELRSSFTVGVISGLKRRLNPLPRIPFIQFDSKTYFGNSGGPLLNRKGEVVGIVSQITNPPMFGFAIPIEYVDRMIKE